MATVSYTAVSDNVNNMTSIITWTGLANGDVGEAISISGAPDKTVHVLGTFGTGGSVTLQGTNDGTSGGSNWLAVTDPQGNAITKTSAAIEVVMENPLSLRPAVTAGDGSTNLTVILVVKWSK